MIVPTKDYSPLMRSNQAKGQAEQSRFIAPTIDYQRKSLEIQKEGIKQKMGAINTQQGFQGLSFALRMGQAAVRTAQVVQDYQSDQASIKTKQAADNWNTALLKGVADGTITMTENGVQGLETLNSLQDSQMADIDSQHWFGSVKRDAKNALKGFYSERENAINQAIYRDTIEKKAAIDQANIDSYINNDASRITDITPDNAYRLTDEYINSRTTWSDLTKENAKITAHAEIDWKRAENSVRMASMRSTQDGHAEADRVADEKNYDYTQRAQLHAIVNGTGKQMTADLGSEGLNTMAQGLQEGIDPMEIWKAADEKTDGLSEEYKTAYKKGMETAHLAFCNDFLVGLTKDTGDVITSSDIKTMKETLEANEWRFKGNDLTEQLYKDTMKNLDEAETLQTSEEFENKYKAYSSALINPVLTKAITPAQAIDYITLSLGDDDATEEEIALKEKLTEEVIKQTGAYASSAIKDVKNVIQSSYKGRFGKDFLEGEGPEYDTLRLMYKQNLDEAETKLMDLCLNWGELSEQQKEIAAQQIRNDFQTKNAEIFKNLDAIWQETHPDQYYGGKSTKKTPEDAPSKKFTDEYTKEANGLMTKIVDEQKKGNSVTELRKRKDVIESVGGSMAKTIDYWRPLLVQNNPSKVDEFDTMIKEKYDKFTENPDELNKYAQTGQTENPVIIEKNKFTDEVTVKGDDQYKKAKALEKDFVAVEHTPQGEKYFGNITKKEKQYLAEYFRQTGTPLYSDEWDTETGERIWKDENKKGNKNILWTTLYDPLNGFVYMVGDNLYRIANTDTDGVYKIQANYGNEWMDMNPSTKKYDFNDPANNIKWTEENTRVYRELQRKKLSDVEKKEEE